MPGVIFSRDRAMQLDAVLRSILLHCQDVERINLWVLYKTTDEVHEKQYQELIDDYSGRVFFKQQENFRHDLLSFLNPFEKEKSKNFIFWSICALGKNGFPIGSLFDRIWRRTVSPILIHLSKLPMSTISKEYFVLFLVDDNLFVQDFYVENTLNVLNLNEKLLGFSLRLGSNTTYCYARKREQLPPKFENLSDNIIQFDWTTSDGDFGYPLEVSSSIYRLQDILPLLMAIAFDSPNILEDRMAYHAHNFRNKYPMLACYQRSVTFCNPVNMVQSDMLNRVGEFLKYSADELSLKFEKGEKIRVEAYSGFVPQSCHQEVDLIFKKRAS